MSSLTWETPAAANNWLSPSADHRESHKGGMRHHQQMIISLLLDQPLDDSVHKQGGAR
ncbi:hypothetical protein [Brevibacillus massiliensis]|uniref:hypothetical protein n=1 Tax=Brevibacillus massiliensis TaxID=1118054 RepID=UPI001375F688|nr:hypothetical protein [Brevibacillus massiliensis]